MNMKKNIPNPGLALIARKQPLGKADADKIELMYLIHFDTLKRNACGEVGRNHIAFSVVTGMFLARMTRHAYLDSVAAAAYESLQKAWKRSGDILTLTTGEYKNLCAFHSFYFKILPNIETGLVSDCARSAHHLLDQNVRVAA
ncbi:hypothetical protein [Undibacterium crateris]|uniref:hypothetical protein n=1 Tax=Undibacterium crateris TaxID=2528175 RepID=UPI001389C717|nr:hypothetical protein [Undibacterium crateris]NDI85113.1 hypothetical protein [Undibacterium crateris]